MYPKLTANYSEALAKLIHSNDAPIDGIEVGPWFAPVKIRHLQNELPDLPFQFHASSFITRYKYQPGALNRLSEYLAVTQSQWVSLHVELLPVVVYVLSSRIGLHLSPLDVERTKSRFIRVLSKAKNELGLPVILENLPSLPHKKYAYAANPLEIKDIVETTDSGFLLDIAHARVAASYQGMNVELYLEKLPLERTIQIHISGVRNKNGYLKDTHETMQDEDYAILNWILERSKPKVVTLEYFREFELLREQLWKLRDIITR